MLRVRFYANPDDPRPVKWPVKHPYWITGQTADGSNSVVVSYADNLDYIREHWPEALISSYREVSDYLFTNRFPRPEWFGQEAELASLRAKLAAALELASMLERALAREWRAASEKPAGDEFVLVVQQNMPEYPRVYYGYYERETDENNEPYGWRDTEFFQLNVSHWMPLPPPPVIQEE